MTLYGIFVRELGRDQSEVDRILLATIRVVYRLNDVNYVTRLTPKSRAIIMHVNKLRPYNEFQLA